MRAEIFLQRKNIEELRAELKKIVYLNEGLQYLEGLQKIENGKIYWRQSIDSEWEFLDICLMDVQELNSEILEIRLKLHYGL